MCMVMLALYLKYLTVLGLVDHTAVRLFGWHQDDHIVCFRHPKEKGSNVIRCDDFHHSHIIASSCSSKKKMFV